MFILENSLVGPTDVVMKCHNSENARLQWPAVLVHVNLNLIFTHKFLVIWFLCQKISLIQAK